MSTPRKNVPALIAALGAALLPVVAHSTPVIDETGDPTATTFYRTLVYGAVNGDFDSAQGLFQSSNTTPAPFTQTFSASSVNGATMTVTESAIPGGFYTSRNAVDMTITNANAADSYYAVAGFGTRTQVQFFSSVDAVRSTYTWRVTGTESAPVGTSTARLDFYAAPHDSLAPDASWFDLFATTPPFTQAGPLGSTPDFGPGTYTYNIPTLLNTPIDLFFWSSAYAQIDVGQATTGSNPHLFANYGSTYELVGIDLYDANDNLITDWTMTDLVSEQTYTRENFIYTPPASVPEPGTLALFGLGLLGLGLARRRKAVN